MQDPVEYLVNCRFPAADAISKALVKRGVRLGERALLDEAQSYRLELRALPPEEIARRCREEQEKQTSELRAKVEREENERFYNQPSARADFEYWAKAPHWTLDEAVALSLGRAPEHVTWKKVEPYRHSAFPREYVRRRELALRAVYWRKLFDPVLPSIFLQWAKSLDLEVPPELESAIAARGIRLVDWQAEYGTLTKQFQEAGQKWEDRAQSQSDRIRQLSARIEELQAAATATPSQIPPPEKPLAKRERESLLKLVIGMAIGGYGYDPSAERSEQTTAIASDLDERGVHLDVDTVRKWLKAAVAEVLPRDDREQGR